MVRRPRVFYGWWMVSAGFLLFFYAGGTFYYGFTSFFNPIRDTFGWSSRNTAFAFALQSAEGGLAGPLVGILLDRTGARPLVLAGTIIGGGGLLWLSRINSLPEFYLAFLLVSCGFSIAVGVALYAAVANWFVHKRALAMGLLAAGYGASGLLVPVLREAIDAFGWRDTMLGIAIGTWVLGLPLGLLIRYRPEDYGLTPDGSPLADPDPTSASSPAIGARPVLGGLSAGGALRTQAFWLLWIGGATIGFSQSTVMAQIVPYLESVGVSEGAAPFAVTGVTVCSLLGRIGFGWMGDFVDKRVLIAGCAALQCAGVLVLSALQSAWFILPFALMYGPGYAGPIPLRPALQADLYGMKAFGLVSGLLATSWTISGMIGPPLAGWVYDTSGTYRWAFLAYALIALLAIPASLAIRRPEWQARTAVEAEPGLAPDG